MEQEKEKKVEQMIRQNLAEEEKRIKNIPFGTVQYWRERCRLREKQDDPTYSQTERDNCFRFHRILVNKER